MYSGISITRQSEILELTDIEKIHLLRCSLSFFRGKIEILGILEAMIKLFMVLFIWIEVEVPLWSVLYSSCCQTYTIFTWLKVKCLCFYSKILTIKLNLRS